MKKARKSKFVIGGVALLSCVALAGVGYSSWVITSTVTSQTGNVSVTAAAVEDDRITIDTVDVTDASYSFGPSTESAGLITASDSSKSEESLSVSFSFDVTYASTLGKTYDITLALASSVTCDSSGDLTEVTNTMDALAYATSTAVTYTTNTDVSGTYLDAPASGLVGGSITIATVTKSGVTASESYTNGTGSLKVTVGTTSTDSGTYTSATITVTAAFGWGSYFGSQNPVNLSDDKYLDDYIEGLQWLNEAFDGAEFTYTIGGAAQA